MGLTAYIISTFVSLIVTFAGIVCMAAKMLTLKASWKKTRCTIPVTYDTTGL